MSQRKRKTNYWQDATVPRGQLVLIPTALEEMIPADHPVRLIDEILDGLSWTKWEATYHGSHGQPPIHPSVLAKTLLPVIAKRPKRWMLSERRTAPRALLKCPRRIPTVGFFPTRKEVCETPFAVIKVMFDMRRFLLRGIEGVGQEWQSMETAFNLKKLMRIWQTLRTFTSETATAVVV